MNQTPVTPVRRPPARLRRGAGLLIGALAAPALGLLLAVPASATPTPEPTQPTDQPTDQPGDQPTDQPGGAGQTGRQRSVFSGTLIGEPDIVGGVIPTFVYRVSVEEVYTPTDITMQRVEVRSRVALETCASLSGGQQPDQPDQPGQGGGGATGGGTGAGTATDAPTDEPTGTGGTGGTGQAAGGAAAQTGQEAAAENQPVLLDTRTDGSTYQVAGCGRVTQATPGIVARVESTLGPGRPPVLGGQPQTDPFAEVDYLCPDTREPLADLAVDPVDAVDSADCEVLADTEPPELDRALAPGAALVVVGFLGLFVARRFGRR